jgi:hypothetical protein
MRAALRHEKSARLRKSGGFISTIPHLPARAVGFSTEFNRLPGFIGPIPSAALNKVVCNSKNNVIIAGKPCFVN